MLLSAQHLEQVDILEKRDIPDEVMIAEPYALERQGNGFRVSMAKICLGCRSCFWQTYKTFNGAGEILVVVKQ